MLQDCIDIVYSRASPLQWKNILSSLILKNHECRPQEKPAPDEFVVNLRGETAAPPPGARPEPGYARLQTEAARLTFLRHATSIPMPRVLKAYDDGRAFVLAPKRLSGVRMDSLYSEAWALCRRRSKYTFRRSQACG